MNNAEYLERMRLQWSNCRGCSLCETRQQIVFGHRNPNAQIMFIGEAPGFEENRTGMPFVGDAGFLLDQLLAETSARDDVIAVQDHLKNIVGKTQEAQAQRNQLRDQIRGLLRDEFYITNVVMCWPGDGNPDPTSKQIAACRPRLLEQIYAVDPVLIIAIGGIAAEAVIGKKITVTRARGEIFDVEFQGRRTVFYYPVMVVLHPAYLLRRNDFREKGDSDSKKTYNDFLRAQRMIDEYNLQNFGVQYPPRRPNLEI